jgi:hypothetical protein
MYGKFICTEANRLARRLCASRLFSGENGSNFCLGYLNRGRFAAIYSFPQMLLLNLEKVYFFLNKLCHYSNIRRILFGFINNASELLRKVQ